MTSPVPIAVDDDDDDDDGACRERLQNKTFMFPLQFALHLILIKYVRRPTYHTRKSSGKWEERKTEDNKVK